MKNLFQRSSRRNIQATFSRYLSLILVSFLGAGMLAGLLAIAPDMESTADEYFQEKNTADLKISSPLGFTDEDLTRVKENKNVAAVTASQTFEGVAQFGASSYTLRVQELVAADKMNQLTLKQGRLPEKANEAVIVIPPDGLKDLKIGVEGTFDTADTKSYVADSTFKIVGVVTSPLYPHNKQGTSSKGKGTVDFVLFTPSASFITTEANTFYVQFKNTHQLNSFSSAYEDAVTADIASLKKFSTQQAQKQYAAQEDKLATAQRELTEQQEQLTLLSSQLGADNPQVVTFSQQLATASTELTTAQAQLATIQQPQWYFEARSQSQGFAIIKADAKSMKSLAAIFPVIFFLVAALVALTSMTRMIDEERTLIGTFQSLGYSDGKIASRYLSYSISSTLIGSVLGVIAGFLTMPKMIWIAYSTQYSLPEIDLAFHWTYALLAVVVMVVITSLVTAWTVRKTLQGVTAELLVPKAPVAGKRIFLERLTFLWRRLSFSQKVTQRNIFLDKKRMLMTVLGVIGSTTLLVTAFGLQNSASQFPKKQYQELTKYNLVASFPATTQLTTGESAALGDTQVVAKFLPVHTEAIEVSGTQKDSQSYFINLVVPQKPEDLGAFVTLKNKQKTFSLTKSAVLLTKNVAERLHLKVGDTFSGKLLSQYTAAQLTLKGIVDNYHLNYLYLSPQIYQETFQTDFSLNQALVIGKNQNAFPSLQQQVDITNVEETQTTMERLIKNMASIRFVVVILIALASMLTIVVLYNVTNINIAERTREIATLKVLGFTDGETYSYVFRETIGLAVMGTILGLLTGGVLFQQIIHSFGTEYYVFDASMTPLTFIYAMLTSAIFTLIINLLMIPKIKKIDMLTSLKSME